jgi:hypothetical protein
MAELKQEITANKTGQFIEKLGSKSNTKNEDSI